MKRSVVRGPAFAVRILEAMFILGMVGSALVVVLTAVDDIRELFVRDDDKANPSPTAMSGR